MKLRTEIHEHEQASGTSDPVRRGRIKDLLMDVLRRDSHERASFIADETDVFVRDEVLRLVAAHDRAGTFMHDPSGRFQAGMDRSADGDELVGSMIGHYQLVRLIGEGGFGRVYLAEQREPVMRQVALKVIKLGMDTRRVITRFEAERQTLAMMEHPGIARVIDAGQTDAIDGSRPYFVMELVPGEPITDYCDRAQLDLEARLELFCLVCQAVQHAHQRGIIHRDLKPSNILVSIVDGIAMPKVIDFGIAKAIHQPIDGAMAMTNAQEMLGTPQYVSPEQADSNELAIDTRTDIYSLGVVLYEMLTGSPPLDLQSLHGVSYSRLIEMIRQLRVERPSTRALQARAPAAESVGPMARDRISWARRLRGELDWILLKALDPDRGRRYDSASAFAEDLRRYMRHEPVVAGPPSAAYRMRKFIRRNRLGVAASVLLTLTLIGGVIGTSIGLWRATQATAQSELEAAKAQRVAEFSQQMLSGINPAFARGKDTQLLRKILEDSAARVEKDLADQPEVEAAIRFTIGSAYGALDELASARPHLERSLEIRRRILGNDHPDTLASAHSMGVLLRRQGQFTEAEPFAVEVLETRRRVLGTDDPATLQSLGLMGNLLWDQGKLVDAEPYFRDVLSVQRRTLGNDHPDTLRSINNLGAILKDQGKYAEAEPFHRECLEGLRRLLGNDHPATLAAITNMARLLGSQSNFTEAEKYMGEGIESYRRVLGQDHSDTLAAINSMAVLLNRQGKYVEAEQMYREVLEARRRALGDDHPNTLLSLNNVGSILADQDRFVEAIAYFGEALERQQRTLGPDHPDTLRSLHNLGAMQQKLGQFREAEASYLEALEGRRRKFGDQSPLTASTAEALASLLLIENDDVHNPQRALELALEASAATGQQNPDYLNTLAMAYFQTGNVAMALETEVKAIELLPADSPAREEYEQRRQEYESSLDAPQD